MSISSLLSRLAFALLLIVVAFGAAPGRAQDVPDASVQEALIKENLITFNDATLTGNYDVLHAKTATPFQEKFAPADLAEMFKGFADQKISIAAIAGLDPIEDAPSKLENGVLTLTGHFATEPLVVRYVLDLVIEGDRWSLIGIDVSARPAE